MSKPAQSNSEKTTTSKEVTLTPIKGGKNANTGTTGCLSSGCKTPEKRFGFCPEHFEQFKFGLIKKNGDPVPDYEKKIDHYQAYKSRQSGRKAA